MCCSFCPQEFRQTTIMEHGSNIFEDGSIESFGDAIVFRRVMYSEFPSRSGFLEVIRELLT